MLSVVMDASIVDSHDAAVCRDPTRRVTVDLPCIHGKRPIPVQEINAGLQEIIDRSAIHHDITLLDADTCRCLIPVSGNKTAIDICIAITDIDPAVCVLVYGTAVEIQGSVRADPVIAVIIAISTGNADCKAGGPDPALLIAIDTAIIDIDRTAGFTPDPMSAAQFPITLIP